MGAGYSVSGYEGQEVDVQGLADRVKINKVHLRRQVHVTPTKQHKLQPHQLKQDLKHQVRP